MSYKLNVQPKHDAFLLTTETGVICGIYRTEKDANKAKSKVRANIINFEKHGLLVNTKFKPSRRKRNRRKSRPSQK